MSPPMMSQQKHKINTIAVTGTNGKTSCTHFIAQAFQYAGFKSAVIGTVGTGILPRLEPSPLTTPDAKMLEEIFAEFNKENVEVVALEASSHGLYQNRLAKTHIDTAIFTNLTRDHLDYHQTMENYAAAKLKLFTDFNLKHAIFNLDDPTGFEWAHRFSSKINTIGITLQSIPNTIPTAFAKTFRVTPEGLEAEISSPWGEGFLKTNLWGKFNLSNLLSVLAVLCLNNINFKKALDYISQLQSVPGRMQLFKEKNKPLVIVDYAHTPDALLKTLEAVREHCQGVLWCVFGCGGDRDKGKRSEMGKIAETYADEIILTNDNPRTENPLEIIANIRDGISQQETIISEPDRTKAIKHAIASAKPNDVILIAGKGHENYQDINGVKIPYSDILTVKMLLLD